MKSPRPSLIPPPFSTVAQPTLTSLVAQRRLCSSHYYAENYGHFDQSRVSQSLPLNSLFAMPQTHCLIKITSYSIKRWTLIVLSSFSTELLRMKNNLIFNSIQYNSFGLRLRGRRVVRLLHCIAFHFLSCTVLFCCTNYCLFLFFSLLDTSSINWIWIWIWTSLTNNCLM